MNNTKEKYNELFKRKEILKSKINKLEENDIVKEYIEYKTKYDLVSKEELDAYKAYKLEEYDECDHLFIMEKAMSISDCICIKCGFKEDAINKNFSKKENLSLDEKIMVEYLNDKSYLMFINGSYCDIVCNYLDAKKAYDEILNNNPLINDNEKIIEKLKEKIKTKKI